MAGEGRPKMRAGESFLRFGVLAVAACLAGAPLSSQESVERQPATTDSGGVKSEANSYSLSGTVLNSLTGEPIRRAAIQAAGQNSSIALTDSGGRFVLDGLSEGNVFLNVVKPGFYAEESSARPVKVGKDAPAVILKLSPWGVISGRVTTRDERPLEGLSVRVVGKRNAEGRLTWVDLLNQARTDDEGQFRIAGLQAGTYYVVADQAGDGALAQKGVPNAREQVFTKVYYPGVSDLSAAAPIEVAPGREAEANLTLTAEPIYHVTGILTGSASSVANLEFERKAGEDSDYSQTVSVAEGKFDAKLPAGAYRVEAGTRDGILLSTPGATVTVRSDEPDLAIPLSAAATIPVDLEKEQGGSAAERRVPLQGNVASVFLQPVSGSTSRRGIGWWRGQAGGIPNVEPGVYSLKVNTAGQWWVKSAKSAGIDLLNQDLTVVDGGQVAPIEVVLRDDGAIVSGTVTPASELAQITVVLVQQRAGKNLIKVARTTQGNFYVQGVAPGEYDLVALEGAEQLEYANPEILNPYLANAEHITVRPHGDVSVNLKLTLVDR